MPNAEKVEKVAALKERIQGSNALLLAEFRGLSVHDATELRRSLSDAARFSVVKNTLMRRAAGEAGIDELQTLLSGPTAIAFVHGDVVTTAKRVVDAAKRFPALVLKGAYMDGKVLDARAAQALATLESREVMLSRIAGILKSEMSRASSMFQAMQSRFLGVLEALKGTLPVPEMAPAAPEESPPPPSPEPEPEPDVPATLEAVTGDEDVPEAMEVDSIPTEAAPSVEDAAPDSPGEVSDAEGSPADESNEEE